MQVFGGRIIKGKSGKAILGLLFLILFFAPSAESRAEKALPVAFLGQLDLSQLGRGDFRDPVPLKGDWSLAQGLLLLPQDWSLLQGSAGEAIFGQGESFRPLETGSASLTGQQSTWRLEVQLPKDAPPLALVMPPMRDAWQVFINGQPFMRAGQPGMGLEDEEPARAQTRIRQLPPGAQHLEITLQLSRHLGGGSRHAVTLPHIRHHAIASRSENLWVSMYYMIGGLVLALALVSSLMWLGRRPLSGYLWFSMLLVMSALYLVAANDMITRLLPDIPDRFVIRLGLFPCFAGLALLVPFYNQYCRHGGMSPQGLLASRSLIVAGRMSTMFLAIGAAASLFLPLHLMVQLADWLVLPAIPVVIWVLASIFRARSDKIPGAGVAMAGAIFLILAVGHDLVHFYLEIHDSLALFPAGLTLFVFTHAVATASRYESAFALAEGQNRALRRTNAGLENRIGQDRLAIDKSNRDLARLATIDELTGLLTRPWFMRQAAREYKRARRFGRPLSVAIIQIDRYEALQAEKGEEHSALIVQETVRRLESVMRDTDVAGLAGEGNIGMVLPETGLEDAGDLCRLMQSVLRRETIGYGGDDQPVTVSLAVTAATEIDIDISSVSMRLDRALEELTAQDGDGLAVRAGMQMTVGEAI